MIRKNTSLGPRLQISPWRRSALTLWRSAHDPSIYSWCEFDVGPAKAYMDKRSQSSGLKLTMTHFVSRAIAEMLRRHPELNVVARGWALYPRSSIDISYTIASDPIGNDLGSSVVRNAGEKDIVQIAKDLQPKILEVREKTDPDHRIFKKLLSLFPHRVSCWLLDIVSWVLYDLNIWSPIFGLPRDPFGCVMITNIGSLGLEQGFAALIPATRIPMIVAVGAVQKKPVVRNNEIVISEVVGLYFTVDHRVIDAVPAGYMVETLRKIFGNPEIELG